ncbi:MAG: thioredoxin family protein [candidate division KSB1 bacterium]|nr:thioredoxin family protein [candidate division KSB1 bacterium]
MVVKVLGMGCPKCQALEAKVKEVAEKNRIDVTIEKVADLAKIQAYRVMMTPALVINEQVKAYGRIPKDEEILKWLKGA